MCDRSCVDDTDCRAAMDNAKTEATDAIAEAIADLRYDFEQEIKQARWDAENALSTLRSELESKITDTRTRVRRAEDGTTQLEQRYRTHSHDRLSGRPSAW